jgi:NADH-quinone oxidoreductase subunit A
MPYESGMDPVHDTRRRFDVRFHLLAIAFLVFDVELLFLYPWAVVIGSKAAPETPADVAPCGIAAPWAFLGGMVFIALLTLGFVYDWKKGIFRWR